MAVVEVEHGASWIEIILNRPERRNALVPSMAAAVIKALEEAQRSDAISSILLRGADGCFCSGIDLKALQANEDPGSQDGKWHQAEIRALHLALYACNKPLVCVLEKYAINAGAALVFASDLVVAGESAFLQVGEVQQGADIPMNAAWLNLKSTEMVTTRLALLGDRIGAQALLELGLLHEIVKDEDVGSTARAWAARMGSFPKGATTVITERLRGFRPRDPDQVFPMSTNNALMSASQVKG